MKQVIADNDYSIRDIDDFMKVAEDEESGEEKAVTLERVRNPSIKVEVIWRGRVVSHYGGTFPVVVIVDHRWFRVPGARSRRSFSVVPRPVGQDM